MDRGRIDELRRLLKNDPNDEAAYTELQGIRRRMGEKVCDKPSDSEWTTHDSGKWVELLRREADFCHESLCHRKGETLNEIATYIERAKELRDTLEKLKSLLKIKTEWP